MDSQVELDVENLFNEDGPLGQGDLDHILPGAEHAVLPDQNVGLPPTLLERMIELTYSGCLKRVAWGRQGHVTTIAEDGSTVSVQCLRLLPGSNVWKLSAASQLDQIFEQAIALSWSPTGVDLAVVDLKGQVYFFTMTTTCLNRLNEVKHELTIPPEEQGQPILTFWLNQDRPERPPRSVVTNFVNQNDQWIQNIGRAKSFAPQSSRAFLMINKRGVISLTYQRPDGQYQRIASKLSTAPDSFFTHAATSATIEGKLLIVLYSVERSMSVYRLQIDWPEEWKTSLNDAAHPVLTIGSIDIDVPMSPHAPDVTASNVELTHDLDRYALTHLEILPTSDIENSVQLPPQIWAVFVAINRSVNATDADFLKSSVIRRWSIIQGERKLHPKFDEMATKAQTQSKDQEFWSVERQPDTPFLRPIVGLEFVDGGLQVAVTTVDGQPEILNPVTMNPASFDIEANEVTSMAQSGFSFTPLAASPMANISPNASSSIVLQVDGKYSVNQALYLGQPSPGLDMGNPQSSAAASSLILTLARACFSNSGSDDILSCIAANYTQEQPDQLIARMYSVLFRPIEFIHEKAPHSQLERMVQKQIVQKGLSFHLALYSSVAKQPLQPNGFPHPSTWSRLWAWITINLRYITGAFFHLFKEMQTTSANSQPTVLAPSYLDMISNMIKYTFDLYRFIFESIIEVGDRQTNPDMFDDPKSSPYFNLGDEKGDGSQGLVALLLNCNWSRFALLAAARPIHAFAKQADSANPNSRQIVDAIRRYSVGRGLSISAVELLFNGRFYQRIGLAEGEPYDTNVVALRQIEMMATGRVGQHYQNTVRDILSNVINSEQGLRNRGTRDMSRLKLFTDTPDLSWVMLNMERFVPSPASGSASVGMASAPNRNYQFYDVHRKAPIAVPDSVRRVHNLGTENGATPQLIRRCTRCGSLSEDIHGTRWDWPKSLVTVNARCVCDGFWILEPFNNEDLSGDSAAMTAGDTNNLKGFNDLKNKAVQ